MHRDEHGASACCPSSVMRASAGSLSPRPRTAKPCHPPPMFTGNPCNAKPCPARSICRPKFDGFGQITEDYDCVPSIPVNPCTNPSTAISCPNNGGWLGGLMGAEAGARHCLLAGHLLSHCVDCCQLDCFTPRTPAAPTGCCVPSQLYPTGALVATCGEHRPYSICFARRLSPLTSLPAGLTTRAVSTCPPMSPHRHGSPDPSVPTDPQPPLLPSLLPASLHAQPSPAPAPRAPPAPTPAPCADPTWTARAAAWADTTAVSYEARLMQIR